MTTHLPPIPLTPKTDLVGAVTWMGTTSEARLPIGHLRTRSDALVEFTDLGGQVHALTEEQAHAVAKAFGFAASAAGEWKKKLGGYWALLVTRDEAGTLTAKARGHMFAIRPARCRRARECLQCHERVLECYVPVFPGEAWSHERSFLRHVRICQDCVRRYTRGERGLRALP